MADFTITADFAKQVQNNVQTGVNAKVYFLLQSQVNTIGFDATTREIDEITMATGKEAFVFNINADEALADFPMSGGTGTFGQQTLTFSIDQITEANGLRIDELDKNTGLCALVILANGKRLFYGIDFQKIGNSSDDFEWLAKFNSGGSNTSGTISDSATTTTNRMQRTYIWNSKNPPVFVASDVSLTTLTAPAA